MNETDANVILPTYNSVAAKALEEHLSHPGAYTVPWSPSIHFDFEATDANIQVTAILTASQSEGIIYGIEGMVVRPTAGTYAGRFSQISSSEIVDQATVAALGTGSLQLDSRLFVQNQDGRWVTTMPEGICSPFLHPLRGCWFMRDPFLMEKNQQMTFILEALRSPGVACRATILLRGTYMVGGLAAGR